MFGIWSILLYAVIYIVLLIALLFLTICCYLFKVHRIYAHIPGPPRDSFFLGNIPMVRKYYRREELSHILFLNWTLEYGPVFKVTFFHKCLVILTGQSGIKEVLTNSAYLKDGMVYKQLFSVCGKRFLGTGLVVSIDHNAWSKRRAVINPAFHKKFLRKLMSQFNKMADLWTRTLMPLADQETEINMMDSLAKVTLDIIGQVGLDTDFKALEDESSPFASALWKILEGFSAQIRDPILKFRPSKRQLINDVKDAVEVMRSKGQKVIDGRLKSMENGQEVPANILTCIAKCKESDPGLTLDDLVDEFCTLLIAGQETTTNTMGFLLKELGRKPEVKQRILEEIEEVIGDRMTLTYEDVSRLDYIGQVIKETLRLYPPAVGTMRTNPSDAVLDGVRIPKGTSLMISFYVLHHMPQYFADPEEFLPERFDPGNPRKFYTYMPFSLGQRSCAGQHFALMEVKILICKFFQLFDYELLPNQPIGVQEMTTLRPKGGTLVRLRHRHKS